MSAPALAPIAHEDFVADIRTLAHAIEAGGWRPDHIVGIGRGGLVPGAYLSHATGISLLSVDQSSGVHDFADGLLSKLAAAMQGGTHILLIDDINDSGRTIDSVRRAIAAEGGLADRMRIAVLIDNCRSIAHVDYRAQTIDRATDKRWFVFPWEQMAPTETLIAESGEVPERLA